MTSESPKSSYPPKADGNSPSPKGEGRGEGGNDFRITTPRPSAEADRVRNNQAMDVARVLATPARLYRELPAAPAATAHSKTAAPLFHAVPNRRPVPDLSPSDPAYRAENHPVQYRVSPPSRKNQGCVGRTDVAGGIYIGKSAGP